MLATTPPRSAYFMAFAECDELDVVGPMAVLQTANRYLSDPQRRPRGSPIDLRIVAVDGSGAVVLNGPNGPQPVVTGIHGITLGVEPWDGDVLPDLLIVAGGNIEPGTGIVRQAGNPSFTTPIRRQFERGARIASVCTGAFGLAGAGIAQGRRWPDDPQLIADVRGFVDYSYRAVVRSAR